MSCMSCKDSVLPCVRHIYSQVVRGGEHHHRDLQGGPSGGGGGPDYKRVFSGESRPSLFEIAGVPVAPAAAAAAGRYPLSDYRPQMTDGGRILGHPAGMLNSREYCT